jgi:hypothetical protein
LKKIKTKKGKKKTKKNLINQKLLMLGIYAHPKPPIKILKKEKHTFTKRKYTDIT